VPKTATEEHFKALPKHLQKDMVCRMRWRERYKTPEMFQVTMKRIYRMATEVDDVVGEVIQELKNQGVYNNTLLVFTTDNGVFMGEHQLAGKWYPHEESIRVPLVIEDPRMPRNMRGKTNDDLTLNIDLAPTLLSAAGIAVPKKMQGRDISQLYLSESSTTNAIDVSEGNSMLESSNTTSTAWGRSLSSSPPWRHDFFYEWQNGPTPDGKNHTHQVHPVFALIRKDYKYFYWPKDDLEQVFHVQEDPFEERDIFTSMSQSDPKKLVELRERYGYLKKLSQSGALV